MRYIHLIKLGLSASVAFSASIGYIMLSHVINIDLTLVFIGVFLMAAGWHALIKFKNAVPINSWNVHATDLYHLVFLA